MPLTQIPANLCTRCGYRWAKRPQRPVKCPHCNSPYWDRPRKKKGGAP